MSDLSAGLEIAYYYPEPYWLPRESDWIKSLLLFFDAVSILLPDYMYGRHLLADPSLAEPLEDQGLLRVLTPETFVDKEMAGEVVAVIRALLDDGVFDIFATSDGFAEISMSRMGYDALGDGAEELYELLRTRGLAKPSADGKSIPLRRGVRSSYLLALAQVARRAGQRQGLDLQPVTSEAAIPMALGFLNASKTALRSQVMNLDLQQVSLDLSSVPLDEVLTFRDENQDRYRRYTHDLRQFLAAASALDEQQQARFLTERALEIQAQARELTKLVRLAWPSTKGGGTFMLGLAGVVVSAAAHDIPAAVVSALTTAVGLLPESSPEGPYSYLFAANRELS